LIAIGIGSAAGADPFPDPALLDATSLDAALLDAALLDAALLDAALLDAALLDAALLGATWARGAAGTGAGAAVTATDDLRGAAGTMTVAPGPANTRFTFELVSGSMMTRAYGLRAVTC
jgi:hypothetical protein